LREISEQPSAFDASIRIWGRTYQYDAFESGEEEVSVEAICRVVVVLGQVQLRHRLGDGINEL
jgi:hypothetical protein